MNTVKANSSLVISVRSGCQQMNHVPTVKLITIPTIFMTGEQNVVVFECVGIVEFPSIDGPRLRGQPTLLLAAGILQRHYRESTETIITLTQTMTLKIHWADFFCVLVWDSRNNVYFFQILPYAYSSSLWTNDSIVLFTLMHFENYKTRR